MPKVAWLVVWLLVLGSASPSFSAPLFQNQALSVGHHPQSVAVGDIDGDGRQDIVSANCGSGDVSVLLSDGDGSFKESIATLAGSCPSALAIADFNRDGKEDLAVLDSAGSVGVLFGLGNGHFDPAVSYAVGMQPDSLVMADFNGDGTPDLATANSGSNDISVLLGRPDGTFTAQTTFATGTGPASLEVGFFNADAVPDLALINLGSDDASVLIGKGDGSFFAELRLASGQFEFSLAVGDFNSDGNEDLLVVTLIPGTVLLPGQGDGTFGSPVTEDQVGGLFLFEADLDGNGTADLLATTPSGLQVLLGTNQGTFADRGAFGTGSNPLGLAAADLNGDGKIDVVTADGNSDTVSVLVGDGLGGFGGHLQVTPLVAVPHPPTQALAADFNDDQKPDLIFEEAGYPYTVWEFLTSAEGSLYYRGYLDFPEGITGMATGDFNGDGNADLSFSFHQMPGVVSLGRGDGTYDGSLYVPYLSYMELSQSADVSGDGKLDLVALSPYDYDDGQGGLLGLILVLPGSGDGTFAAQYTAVYLHDHPSRLVLADFNGDGKLDLATIGANSGGVIVLLQSGNLSFEELPSVVVPDGAAADLASGDFDGDGKIDIAVSLPAAGKVAILSNDGMGHLSPTSFLSGGSPSRLAAGDFNADYADDVAVLDSKSNFISILAGDGHGALGPPQRYLGGERPDSILAVDLNLDNRLDLVVGNVDSQDFSILLNQGPHPICQDADGDGFGFPGSAVCPGGSAPDCDDTRASVFPGATEICDGLDNDCNGEVDEGFPDREGDGVADCHDNCPELWNPDQADANSNGTGDACEAAALFAEANLSHDGFSASRVDGRDLALFADAFGACPGDAGFLDAANLDRVPASAGPPGACVGLADFHLFMEQFGHSQ